MSTPDYKLITFAPEQWGQLDRFQRFYPKTYAFDFHTQKAVGGAANHLRKAWILCNVTKERVGLLEEDHKQFQSCGYTPANRAKELSALVETVILELYSVVDCTRKVVTFIYRDYKGVAQSTHKFFQRARDGKIDEAVPQVIRDTFAFADWYSDFRRMRDELTHADIGSCNQNTQTGKVAYFHLGLGDKQKALVIDDIFSYLDNLFEQVNVFLGRIFAYLNGTLSNSASLQICGFFGGRVYTRYVKPQEAKDFNSGRCDAYKWFEKEGNPPCPFMSQCKAYGNRSGEEGPQS